MSIVNIVNHSYANDMKKNETGFGIIGIVMIVVAILAVGLVGWYVMTSMNKKKAPTTTTPAATNQTQATTNNTDGATKYLEIKEWGIKFALTTDTADAYYDTKTSSPLDSMSLRTHSLDSEPECKTGPQSVSTIFRVKKDAMDDSISGKKYSETQDGKTIGDYFYFIQSSQSSCTEDTEKKITLQGVRNSFNTAGSTIQKL